MFSSTIVSNDDFKNYYYYSNDLTNIELKHENENCAKFWSGGFIFEVKLQIRCLVRKLGGSKWHCISK